MNLDWQSSKNHLLFNPRFHPAQAESIKRLATEGTRLRGQFLVTTSGSTRGHQGEIKLVALSKSALLASAMAVNRRIQSSTQDIWMHTLPSFHVGGVGIWARSHLSGAKVVDFYSSNAKWNPNSFRSQLEQAKGTLVSLVPTQVYDLVQMQLKAPACLRASIVGGGRLGEQLYFKAQELGWNLLPSYGMTESSSQIAAAELRTLGEGRYPPMKLLDCFEAQVDAGTECLKLKGEPLLTGYYLQTPEEIQFVDPKQEGWFLTEDRGTISDGFVAVTERRQDFLKISGESVSLPRLDGILEEIRLTRRFQPDVAITVIRDERLGHALCLAVAAPASSEVNDIAQEYNSVVLPFERIRQVYYVEKIQRTVLGKLIRHIDAW
jgi:O-succinylbenzoic acid--CoA ligase